MMGGALLYGLFALILISGCVTISFPTQIVEANETHIKNLSSPIETYIPSYVFNETLSNLNQVPLVRPATQRTLTMSQLQLPVNTPMNFQKPGEKIESKIEDIRDSVQEFRDERMEVREEIKDAVQDRREVFRDIIQRNT